LLKAATALGISQPALTRNLQELEDILQARVFDRHPRGVRVTEAGMVLVRAAGSVATFDAGSRVICESAQLIAQLATRNGSTMNIAWALMSLPLKFARLFTVTFTPTAFRTAAAYGCLKPAPTRPLRRAYHHLKHSTVSSDTFLAQSGP
jgi:Bacterial regulatory helix-turn-helix protein, lysR family